uniref:Glycosyltransferase n=1 Tax=Thermorudis sp. TaxID=1969470 RepID=A0A7C3ARW9_9BACT
MDFIEQRKSSVDIVRVVGEYVRLKRAGAGPRYTGLCPFHPEKTPSFSVHSTHQFYKCFGCGAGGDVIKFVMEIERLTFWEAVKLLAERNGIPLPKQAGHGDEETRRRAALYEMHELAARLFGELLDSAAGREARDYLERRGVSRAAAQEFGLGLSDRSGQMLVRAFERLADCMPDLELALGGKRGWQAEPIEQAIACSRHRERIHLLGYIPEEDLPALYSAAAVFTLPSLYEGFGLPALEAMACGVPVVASNRGALPEIARPALLVDPLDVDALAERLRQALQPDARQRLVAAGLEHARRFRWEVAGRATLEVLEEAARSGRRRSEA